MYKFWYDYVKPKYGEKTKYIICVILIQLYCFILYIKADDVLKDIAKDVETRFDTSNYEFDRPLPKGKNKKVIGLLKDELGKKIMTKFVGLRVITYSYLIEMVVKIKKQKLQKMCHQIKN